MLNHLSCISFSIQCFVSLHSSKIRFASSFSKHNGHLPLSAFLLVPYSCHIPAISHPIPLLSFLEQHSMYNFLPQEKFSSLHSVNELFSGYFANTNVIRVIKSRRLKWKGHVARMRDSKCAYRILVGRT